MGADAGKKVIIFCALYGPKSDGAALPKNLDDCMRHVRYNQCPADLDMYIKPKVDIDGNIYYPYILCYVEDILVVHHNAMTMLSTIEEYFKLKHDSIGDQGMYIGSKLCYHRTNNGTYAWYLRPTK